MGLFDKLFGTKEPLEMNDPVLGVMHSFYRKGKKVGWDFYRDFWGEKVTFSAWGDENGISESLKGKIEEILNREKEILQKSENALREEFGNADKMFISIDKHFEMAGVFVSNNDFQISLSSLEEDTLGYIFDVYFDEDYSGKEVVWISINS